MGTLAALVSAIFATSKDLLSKRVSRDVDGTVSTFASFFFALPFYVVLMGLLWILGYEDFAWSAGFWGYVLIRSITDAAAEWLKMTAFQFGDLSVVACFFSLSPIFLLLLSPLITGDALTSTTVAGVVLVVIGTVLMVYRPGTRVDRTQFGAIGLATAASVFFALNSCFDRLAVQTASPTMSGFAMTALSCAFFVPAMWRSSARRIAVLEHAKLFTVRGALEVGFMVLKLTALRYLSAPYVVVLQRTSMILSVLAGRYIFKEQHIGQRLLAGTVIFIGVVVCLFGSID